jgi:hypothetical protein
MGKSDDRVTHNQEFVSPRIELEDKTQKLQAFGNEVPVETPNAVRPFPSNRPWEQTKHSPLLKNERLKRLRTMEMRLNVDTGGDSPNAKGFSVSALSKPDRRMSVFNLAGRKSLEVEEKVFDSDSSSSFDNESDKKKSPVFSNADVLKRQESNGENLAAVFDDFSRFYAESAKSEETPRCII